MPIRFAGRNGASAVSSHRPAAPRHTPFYRGKATLGAGDTDPAERWALPLFLAALLTFWAYLYAFDAGCASRSPQPKVAGQSAAAAAR